MNASKTISGRTFETVLDREVYQIIWQNLSGDICIDGGGKLTDLSRESALDAYREGNVLKVFCINFVEQTCRDVTDEIAGEIEYEAEQAYEYDYAPRKVYRSLENAGRTL
ncbi:hypothetical protein IB024_01655 [Brucella sp. 6810]|uniref:hypothetical protein n=1 Tax=Brucella sp. 6810 TaxID=2769351 RepID=UPI00165A6488|nr:hypothetical protein [Brucella sp. 6810]QNQ62489.1 hypothetical protein IB024_01655 [Brucella sp. 6810]